jgi:hypothetical protein
MKKNSLIVVALLISVVGCKPSTPKQLIRRFDACFLQYGKHKLPEKKYPLMYHDSYFFDEILLGGRDVYIIDYKVPIDNRLDLSILEGQPQGLTTELRVFMFSPFNTTRDDLFRTLKYDSLRLSPVTIRDHQYYLYEYGEVKYDTGTIVSYYNEIIYMFVMDRGIPENNKIILDHAFECIDEATGR